MNPLPKVIDEILCYEPNLALDNSGYHPDALKILAEFEEKNFWHQSRNLVLKKILKKYTGNQPVNFLEVGCGNGIVLNALTELKNFTLTGSDIYLSGLQFARSYIPSIKFIQLDARNIPFQNEYDVIGCFDVLEHIDEDFKVISEMSKALKKNGYLFITVPQYQWMWSEIDLIDRHKRRYTKHDISKKIADANLQIVYTNCFAFTVFPIMVLSRLFRLRKYKPNSGKSQPDDKKPEYPELDIPDYLNHFFRLLMRFDEWLIGKNVKLPFGGSIVLVAKKI